MNTGGPPRMGRGDAEHQEDDPAEELSHSSPSDRGTKPGTPDPGNVPGQEPPEIDLNNSRRPYGGNLHHEPESLPLAEPSAAATAAAATLEPSKKSSRRRKDSGHAKGYLSRSEPHRSIKVDRPFSFFFKEKAGTDVPSSKEYLVAIRERDQWIEDLEDDFAKSEKRVRRLKREVSDLAKQNEELQRQIQTQDSQIRSVQDHQLKNVEIKGFLRAEDDGSIRQKFRTMTSRWKAWARDYSIKALDHVSDADHPAAIQMYRHHRVPEELLSPKNINIAPAIILNAVLARFLTNLIFHKPFFSLPNGLDMHGEPSKDLLNVSEAFSLEYERVQKQGDRSLAHVWRSLTLLMVDPPEHDAKSQPGNYDEARKRKDAYYHRATNTFENYARVLYRKLDNAASPQRWNELYDIIRAAGELFSSLWKQKVYIESRLDYYHGTPFNVTSKELEAHPALHLEDGDTRLDGAPVEIVIQPAILAWGNEEGKYYDYFKVWAKAIVWVGAQPPPIPRHR